MIAPPLHDGRRLFAGRAGCCPDCWQEFWTGRTTAPSLWYEDDAMATSAKGKKRAKHVGSAVRTREGLVVVVDNTGGIDGLGPYGLNEHGVYTTPIVVEVPVPKKYKSRIELLLAERPDGQWSWGLRLDLPGPASNHALPQAEGVYMVEPTRPSATLAAMRHAILWLDGERERLGAQQSTITAATAALDAVSAVYRDLAARSQDPQPDIPPGLTSTTTPAGIAAIDPAARAAAEESVHHERLLAGPTLAMPLYHVVRHPANRHPSPEAVTECAASLAATGQLEPLVVRFLPVEGKYQILSGETRWLAAQRLGWHEIAARVVEADDAEAVKLVAEHNAHRHDLNPIEQARLIETLCRPVDQGGGGLTREQAARSVGLESGSAASNLVRLLSLPQVWQDRVAAGELPQTWARALLAIADDEQALEQAAAVWHTWRTRDDVIAFVDRVADGLPDQAAEPDAAEPADKERFPGNASATGSASADDEAALTTDDIEDGSGDDEDLTAADGEEVLGDDEPARVARDEPVGISERLRGAVEEWRTRWLCQIIHDVLPFHQRTALRLFTWLACRRDTSFDLLDACRAAAEIRTYATSDECWRTIGHRSTVWIFELHVKVCQTFLSGCLYVGPPEDLGEYLHTILDDLAHLMGQDIRRCWKKLQESSDERDRACLEGFYACHTAGELADLGRMIGHDCAHWRTKSERIKCLAGVIIPLPPYLRDWSS